MHDRAYILFDEMYVLAYQVIYWKIRKDVTSRILEDIPTYVQA